MITKTFKSGIELIKDHDENGEKRYTAVDPNGYIGRTRIAKSWSYYAVLAEIRTYIKNNK